MRPLASPAYQSVCASRSALPIASKYDRTTVLVSVGGAVASLVVMVVLRFGANVTVRAAAETFKQRSVRGTCSPTICCRDSRGWGFGPPQAEPTPDVLLAIV